MKTPFQFPTYEMWEDEFTTANLCGTEADSNGEYRIQFQKAYALFYLLALRDWVNEELGETPKHVPKDIFPEYFDGEWNSTCNPYISSLFTFCTYVGCGMFLSHKSDHTDTITQINILYSINQ